MQEKKGKIASNNRNVYLSRCFLIKLQLPMTMVLVRLKLITEKATKNKKEEFFKETKVYKQQQKNFNLT